jgi:dethiobiotin synthase
VDHDPADLERAADAIAQAARATAGGVAADSPSPPPRAGGARLRALAVVGTDTGVGKTAAASLLLAEALQRGPAAYWKPVQSGSGEDDDTAVVRARFPAARVFEPAFAFPEPVAPAQAARAAGIDVTLGACLETAERVAAEAEGILVIEAAGGLLVPLGERLDQEALLARLRVPAVLVARTALGTLNHTRLTLEGMRARGIPLAALVLVGAPHAENEADLARLAGRAPCLRVPSLERLDAVGLGLARILDGIGTWTAPAMG